MTGRVTDVPGAGVGDWAELSPDPWSRRRSLGRVIARSLEKREYTGQSYRPIPGGRGVHWAELSPDPWSRSSTLSRVIARSLGAGAVHWAELSPDPWSRSSAPEQGSRRATREGSGSQPGCRTRQAGRLGAGRTLAARSRIARGRQYCINGCLLDFPGPIPDKTALKPVRRWSDSVTFVTFMTLSSLLAESQRPVPGPNTTIFSRVAGKSDRKRRKRHFWTH